MKRILSLMAFCSVMVAVLLVTQPVSAQTIVDLGTLPGGTYSAAYGINGAGQIVGVSDSLSSAGNATLWDPSTGRITDLGTLPGGTSSLASGINDLGQAVGFSEDTRGGIHATLWDTPRGTITDLGTLQGFLSSIAFGINSRGQVVGYSSNYCYGCASISSYRYQINATLWDPLTGRIIDLGTLPGGTFSVANGINDLGQIVGVGNDELGEIHATLWNAPTGTITDLGRLTGGFSQAIGINDKGQIVGISYSLSRGGNATLWNASTGESTDLGALPGFTLSAANGINDFGQIVGGSGRIEFSRCARVTYGGPTVLCEGLTNATLWNASTGESTDLGALFGFTESAAYGINNLGQIVGESHNSLSGTNNATLWKVSVPSTTPVQQIQEINTNVQDLVISGKLNQGQGDAFIAKLNAVTQNLNTGNTKAAINELNAFINQVEAYIKSGKLSSEEGQALIVAANALIDQMK